MNCLIVDDNPINRKVLLEYLAAYGNCDVAGNGLEAVEQFEAELTTGEPYDLILLDLMMPKMNGQNAMRKIRDIERKNNVQVREQVVIIIVTAVSSPKDMLMMSGCDRNTDVLKKPVKKVELMAKLKEYGLL